MILDPTTIPMLEYMDRVALLLGPQSGGAFPVFSDGMHWKEWASAVVLLPVIAAYQPPSPHDYEEWLDWAYGFNKTVMVNIQ